MLDENPVLSPAANAMVAKAYEPFGSERWALKERSLLKDIAAFPEPEPIGSTIKRDPSAKKKEVEKVAKLQTKKGGSDPVKDSKAKRDKAAEDESELEKLKNSKKNVDDMKQSRFKKKGKESEKVDAEEKTQVESKAKGGKPKAVSAFGTTYYKSESEAQPVPKQRPSSMSDRLGRSRRSQSREGRNEEEDGRNSPESRKSQSNGEDGKGKSKTKGGKTRSMQRIGSDSSLQDERTGDGKKSSKVKVITAFGSTFRKSESEAISLPKKKTPSFTDRLMRSKSARLKEVESDVEGDTPSKLCLKQSGTKTSISKNKLMDMVEESGKDKSRGRGAYSTSTGKRARSPYQTSSDMKSTPSKVRVEGDTNGNQPEKTEKPEIGKEMSFFEKIQQNVRAYFSPRSAEMGKFEDEKKRVQEGEKRRTASFHRSKTLQKNALAEPSSKCSKSIDSAMEPDQQIENVSSADGVASAFAQVQEFHEEITWRNWEIAASAMVQEEYLTPIVNCLPGDFVPERTRREGGRTGVRRSSSNRPFARRKIRASRSEEIVRERNLQFSSAKNEAETRQGDVPQKLEKSGSKMEKPHFVPKRHWFVYSLTETKLSECISIQTPPRRGSTTTVETTTPDSDISAFTADEVLGESDGKMTDVLPSQKSEEASASFTLKDIISLTRKVFRESDSPASNAENQNVPKRQDPSLGYYLEKLMEEKKNYLNLEKTKNFRKTQKVNFIADSFNFFNLLNKEFLSVRTSDPSIDQLRNIITENKGPKMEEYLDVYKKVIRASLTEPQQSLMDKAKMDLERYTDMYYDLMKYICTEGKKTGRSKAVSNDPPRSAKSTRMNYYEIFKQDTRKNVNSASSYLDKTKPKLKKSFYITNFEENRNREFNMGKNYRTQNPRKGLHSKEQKLKSTCETEKMKQIVELLSPLKKKETLSKKDVPEAKKEDSNQGNLVLQISVCDNGLIIKQLEGSAEGNTYGTTMSITTKSSEEEKKNGSINPEEKQSSARNSVSEAKLGASIETSSEEVEKTQSELLLKTESDVTVYPKSSLDEENDSSESAVEHPLLKFRAFRKLLIEGLKYLKSVGGSQEMDCHECPKIPKGGRVPEGYEKLVKYPKTTICVREPNDRKFHDDYRLGHHKSTFVKDARQMLRDRASPVRSRINEVQEEKARRLLKGNLSSYGRGVSPSKISKREPVGEGKKGASLWWRNEKTNVNSTSPVKEKKLGKKPEGTVPSSRISKTAKEAVTAIRTPPLRERTKSVDEKESAKKEKLEEELQEQESRSEYSTPTGSFFERQFGMKNLKDLQSEEPENVLNPGGVAEGKLICEEAEEKELRKTDLTCGDERNQESEPQMEPMESNAREAGLRLRSNNPLRTDWDQLLYASYQKDYQKLSVVLNQFMGNISEAWKAAVYLKDLIQPKPVEEQTKEEPELTVKKDATSSAQQGVGQNEKGKVVESFRNFLRILTSIFESNQGETSVRKELFLMMKEVLESSSAASPARLVLKELPTTGNRTIFHEEIAEMPQEVREMIAEALVSEGKIFSRSEEDYAPGSFVTAVKDVGEKLKNLYFAEECKRREEEEEEKEPEKMVPKEKEEESAPEEQKKIFYRPSKKDLSNKAATIKSNLQFLGEKINRIYGNRKSHDEPKEEKLTIKKLVQSKSSIYFDAIDMFRHSDDGLSCSGRPEVMPDRISLDMVDESYFALGGKTFGKYRDLIYDKIITFIKSDNPYNFNYGMTLLGKMLERDKSLPTVKEEGDEEWYDLVEKLMDTCRIIKSEVKEEEEKLLQSEESSGKKTELARTCEYLKKHVARMKDLMEEVKTIRRGRNSTAGVRALEESRQTNMERQLMNETKLTGTSFLSDRCLDNAISFINSIGTIGCSIDKFSKNFLSNWLGGSTVDKLEPVTNDDDEEFKDGYESVLENNKAFVMSLKKTIERRQKKIKEIMDQAEKEGIKKGETLSEEKLSRKVRDLKKCYNLLEKMICDPTMLPPKWLKISHELQDVDEEIFRRKLTPETDFHVMTVLEDIISSVKASGETSLGRLSQSKKPSLHQLPIGLFAFINFANSDCDSPVEGQGQRGENVLFPRPKTA